MPTRRRRAGSAGRGTVPSGRTRRRHTAPRRDRGRAPPRPVSTPPPSALLPPPWSSGLQHRRGECSCVTPRRRERHRTAADRRQLPFLEQLVQEDKRPRVAEKNRVLLLLV